MLNRKIFLMLMLTTGVGNCLGSDHKASSRADFNKGIEGRKKDDARRKHYNKDKKREIDKKRLEKEKERAKASRQAEQAARKATKDARRAQVAAATAGAGSGKSA
jgi:hypothetical protein